MQYLRNSIGNIKKKSKFYQNNFFFSGLPHTQGTQGNSGNFQVIENFRKTQGILILFFT